MVREDFLQQNAFMDVDSFSDYERQKKLLGMILSYDVLCRDAIAKGASAQELFQIPARERSAAPRACLPRNTRRFTIRSSLIWSSRSLPLQPKEGTTNDPRI